VYEQGDYRLYSRKITLEVNHMLPELQAYRDLIITSLTRFLEAAKKEYREVNHWSEDLMDRLARFSTQGKMVRGSLVLFSHALFARETPQSVVLCAAAMELIHSSLLVHDDIMDRDSLRRGSKTIFYQYQEVAKQAGRGPTTSGQGDQSHENPDQVQEATGQAGQTALDAAHFGTSMGICAGDIGFFAAFGLLAEADVPAPVRTAVISKWSAELTAVGLAQMQDLGLSAVRKATEEEILKLYRYKTARYTFSLPLWTGAFLAGQGTMLLRSLEELGETLGVIFQIKDDEIGLFGAEDETGKSVGGDLQEGKQTLYRYNLAELLTGQKLPAEDRDRLRRVLGGARLEPGELDMVRGLIHRYEIDRKVGTILDRLVQRARKQISLLPVGEDDRGMFSRMLSYNLERKR
jgi:geranylgeranyl diphosphate synthase type I